MPEPYEGTSDQPDEFIPSTPDLTPNLGEYVPQGQGESFRDNDDGRVARELNIAHQYAEGRAEEARQNETDGKEVFRDAHIGIGALSDALQATHADDLMQRAVLTEAMKILEKRKDTAATLIHESGERADSREATSKASLYDAGSHYRSHEEAYKNQAVNDYHHAKAQYPERYPEPLNYPQDPETSDQPSQTTE